ncbi:MAG: Uma2 family endonuclease [Dehalococcoidia bacterium]
MPSIIALPVLLESGDRLSRQEFHRRFCLHPELKKAELVEGVVYVPSPARFTQHAEPQRSIVLWLRIYAIRHPGTTCGFEATIYLDEKNEVQPDAFLLFRDPPPGGARVRDYGYIEGAPPLIVEVAASSASYDLHDKLQAYQRAGVVEYLVWRVYDQAIDWFRLQDGAYLRVEPDEGDIIESHTFPGLRLNVARLLAGDEVAVLAELEAPSAAV